MISLLSLLILNIFNVPSLFNSNGKVERLEMQQATQLLPAPKEGLNIAEKDLVDLLVSVYDTFCSFKGTNYARLRNIRLNLQLTSNRLV